MTMTQHTPTPYEVSVAKKSKNDSRIVIMARVKPETVEIADLGKQIYGDDVTKANAAFLVAAANSHEALVSLLTRAFDWLQETNAGDFSSSQLYDEIQAALAAQPNGAETG